MKYQSGGAFRRALEDRLLTNSGQTGTPLVRLRKMVAFDRYLARLLLYQSDQWILKGGLALQLWLGDRARTTMDMDIQVLTGNDEISQTLRKAGSLDLGDWFSFEVPEPERQTAIGFGGVRYQVHALLDGRRFDSFHIDVGSGDPLIEPVEYLTTPNLLFFADLEPTRVPCYPIPQQLAEKLHAYTRPRKTGESSRVKDFVDILLLAEYGEISGQGLIRSIEVTFHRAGTHAVPANMPPPPKNWSPVFRRLADDVGMRDRTLDQAFSAIQRFLDPILSEKASGMWWNLVTWSWIKK